MQIGVAMRSVMTLGLVAIVVCALLSQMLHAKRTKETFDSVSASANTSQQPKLFMFAENQCSPECCPGQFSCSGGCVCLTKQQEEILQSRGNNSHVPTTQSCSAKP